MGPIDRAGVCLLHGMVFEVYDTHPENSRALFGGGRYDNLTALFDGEAIPGVGMACGDETLRLFMETRGLIPPYAPPTQVYIAVTAPEVATTAQTFAGQYLRQNGINAAVDFGEKRLADQIKTAVKHKIPFLIVLGQDELATEQCTVRDLASGDERIVRFEHLPDFFLSR